MLLRNSIMLSTRYSNDQNVILNIFYDRVFMFALGKRPTLIRFRRNAPEKPSHGKCSVVLLQGMGSRHRLCN